MDQLQWDDHNASRVREDEMFVQTFFNSYGVTNSRNHR
ncbi:hypothetical protein FHW03_004188 [Ochrobactrum sp. RH2CCR150]|nr:hypothetical protein [Ochrobactrum sp. RH2CCR150]